MLPAAHRLRTPTDFRSVLRGRRDQIRVPAARSGGRLLVLHVARLADEPDSDFADAREEALPRVGFVVSKAVGVAVVRNRVKRVLRHRAADVLDRLPAGSGLVVRAQPAAGQASSSELVQEFDRLLDDVLRRLR